MEAERTMKNKGHIVVIEELKEKLLVTACKIKRCKEKNERLRQNRMFQNFQRRFYIELGRGKDMNEKQPPDNEQTRTFWSADDRNNLWLEKVNKSFDQVERQENLKITPESLDRAIRGLPKLESTRSRPSTRVKNIHSLHPELKRPLSECSQAADMPV